MCEAIRSVWKPSPELQELMEYEQARLEAYPHPLIAVQLRGGDKIAPNGNGNYGELPPGYIYDIEKGIERLNISGGTCVLMGDDSTLAERAVRALDGQCHVINRVLPHHKHDQEAFNAGTEHDRCQSTKQVLVDINIMLIANLTIGLGVSNVIRIASLLQRCFEFREDILDWGSMNVTALSLKPQGF